MIKIAFPVIPWHNPFPLVITPFFHTTSPTDSAIDSNSQSLSGNNYETAMKKGITPAVPWQKSTVDKLLFSAYLGKFQSFSFKILIKKLTAFSTAFLNS